MEKIGRYIMIFIGILTLAIFIPKLYWTILEKPIRRPIIHYSCVSDQFMINRGEKEWTDAKGNKCSRDEYEQMLPMMFFKQLLASGTMPDSIKGKLIRMPEVSREESFFKLKAEDVDAPEFDIFPMFESRSGRAKFELPEDFFRITWRIEFIDASSNSILEEKSQMFSAALYHYGFSFPAKMISGIATPRKSCDEGYFIVDSKDQLFHMKMIKGKPYVKKIDLPEGLKFKHIGCVDFKNKAFYAYLFSEKNEIYILTQDEYKLVKWPVDGYDPATCDLKISGDLFNYTVVIEANDHLKALALDKQYKLVDAYSVKWPVKEDLREGKIFASIFPAQISMTSDDSKFIRLYYKASRGYNWIFFNLGMVVLHFLWLYWQKKKLKKHIADLAIVAISGIYGFIAIHLFQNKFFD